MKRTLKLMSFLTVMAMFVGTAAADTSTTFDPFSPSTTTSSSTTTTTTNTTVSTTTSRTRPPSSP